MSIILTGIQATGTPHIGNLLGAIEPMIAESEKPDNITFGFIANLHSLTAIKDPLVIKQNTYAVAATWLAMGFDVEKNVFYRQSDIPQVTELAWYLNCYMSFQRLSLAHSFKDKSENLADVNAGLFCYPVLMAADILLYDAEFVPVGKDQQQHLEFTRDLAQKINHQFGEVFTLPEAVNNEKSKYVIGTDGRKMSKSYGNTITIFDNDKQLKKAVMGIITDQTPMEAPKNPDTCSVFKLYALLAPTKEVDVMRQNYLNGNYGYGHAKMALLELIQQKYAAQRDFFNTLMNNTDEIEKKLLIGKEKAADFANTKLQKVRSLLGF